MITLRVDEKALESVLEAALKAPELTATERWNIAFVANVAARARADAFLNGEIPVAPI